MSNTKADITESLTITAVPPVVPVCPPPPLIKSSQKTANTNIGIAKPEVICEFHENIEPKTDVRNLCSHLIRRSPINEGQVMLSFYTPIKPVLQTGPMCGIVSLAMALELLMDTPTPVDNLLQKAKGLGYTNAGEMFSAENLGHLATTVCKCKSEVSSGTEQSAKILRHLAKGMPILVPYDKDANMQPCMKKGMKAHWATISGFLLIIDKHSATTLCSYEVDDELKSLLHANMKSCDSSVLTNLLNTDTITSICIFAKQGKSKYTGLWSLEDLLKSNDNLMEIDPKVLLEIEDPVLPPGGIQAGLKSKLLFLTKL